MAIKATIFKAELNIADMDRHYYGDHHLTIARHPSENDERMMVRLLAFALNASDSLQFTRGISTENEPDLWQKSLSGEIELWIELGQPDEKRLRRASALAGKVIVYCYQPRSATPWWQQMASRVAHLSNLTVYQLPENSATQLAGLAARTMQLQCTVQDGEAWLSNGTTSVHLTFERWQ